MRCCDDIAGQVILWCVACQDREQKLGRFLHLGVYEKIDERSALEKFIVAQVDTKWIATNKPFEEELVLLRSRLVAREFVGGTGPEMYAGTPMEAWQDALSIPANHKRTILNCAHRRVSCSLSCKSAPICSGEVAK